MYVFRNSTLQFSRPLFLFLPLLCGWGSSLHSVEMPAAGAKFNSKSKHKQCLRIETPLRFTQLQFYQFPPGKDFSLKLLCIPVHSGMQAWVFGVGQFTYRTICSAPHPPVTLCAHSLGQRIVQPGLEGMAGKHFFHVHLNCNLKGKSRILN